MIPTGITGRDGKITIYRCSCTAEADPQGTIYIHYYCRKKSSRQRREQ